jgi:DNA-binding NarL/FixJ family response regulator
VPSGGGVGTALAIAHAYSVFATGGSELGLRQETLDLLAAPATPPARLSELVLGGYLAGTSTKHKEKSKVAQLTERECEVMRLLADGMSSKEAATRLQISKRTVESHRINISRKLGFNSIAKLVHYAIRHGIVAHS